MDKKKKTNTNNAARRSPESVSPLDSEEKVRIILENIQEGYFEVDLEGRFTFLNDSVSQTLGYSKEELIGADSRTFTDKKDVEKVSNAYRSVFKTGDPVKNFGWHIIRKDGAKRYVEGSISLRRGVSGQPVGFRVIANDFTERRHAEEELRRSEEKYRSILENIQDSYFEVDLAGNFTFFNDSLCRLTGCTREELAGGSYTRFSDQENSEKVFQTFNKVFKTREPSEGIDWMITRKDGEKRYIEATVSLRKDFSDKPVGFRGIIRDITERKQTAEAMEKSEKKFASLFQLNPDPIAISDVKTGKFIDVNQAFLEFSGYSREDVLGVSSLDINLWVNPEDRKKILGCLNDSGEVQGLEAMMRVKGGSIRNVLFSARFIDIEQKHYLLTLAHDITKRKQVEERYRNIFENAQEGIYQSTPEGKFLIVNNSVARILGYDSPEDVIAGMNDITFQLYVDPEDRKKFTDKIEKEGVVRDYEVRFYRKDRSIIWVSLTALGVRDEKGHMAYYEGIIEDITDRKESVERLRKALAGTVGAIALMVETRDPYTAGHQRNVGDLARAIAREMGLPGDRIEGLRVAAIIHDIGKISVPAEILSKPSKLTDIEFSIIKTHSQAGYDILKDIDFPWPVARMVIEHHERIDGSGYPQNLIGEEILLESRILSVADVVEAISAHRPYRPSLGMNVALEEIRKNRDRLYDASVVDACLRLFNEKGYQLKERG